MIKARAKLKSEFLKKLQEENPSQIEMKRYQKQQFCLGIFLNCYLNYSKTLFPVTMNNI